MPGKSSRRWASRFLPSPRRSRHDQGGRRAWPRTDASARNRSLPTRLAGRRPADWRARRRRPPAGDEPGGGKPGFGPALERRQRLRLPDRGLPVVGGVSRHPHTVRGQGVAQPVAACVPRTSKVRAGSAGSPCSTAHRASESWLGASAGGCRTVVFAPKPGSSRRPCALAGPTVAAITAGARKSRRARGSAGPGTGAPRCR